MPLSLSRIFHGRKEGIRMASNVMSVAYNQLNALYGISTGAGNRFGAHKKKQLIKVNNGIIY